MLSAFIVISGTTFALYVGGLVGFLIFLIHFMVGFVTAVMHQSWELSVWEIPRKKMLYNKIVLYVGCKFPMLLTLCMFAIELYGYFR